MILIKSKNKNKIKIKNKIKKHINTTKETRDTIDNFDNFDTSNTTNTDTSNTTNTDSTQTINNIDSQSLTNSKLTTILAEAENITLDDLEFDNILKEQSQILCDIKSILHNQNNDKNKETFKCNISNLKKDIKFKSMIRNFVVKKKTKIKQKIRTKSITKPKTKTITKPKTKTITKPKTKSITKPKTKSITKPKTKSITKPKTKSRKCSRSPSSSYIKYENKRKFDIDVQITKPNIYIKDLPKIHKLSISKK